MLHDAFKRDRLAWEGQRGDLFFQLDDLLDIRDTKNQYGSIGYIQDLKVKLGGHRLDEFIDLVRKIPNIVLPDRWYKAQRRNLCWGPEEVHRIG